MHNRLPHTPIPVEITILLAVVFGSITLTLVSAAIGWLLRAGGC